MHFSPEYLPALAMGLLMTLYWARVIKLVLKAKRRTGRGAGIVPTEPLGRVLRVIWYPAVGIWCFYPMTLPWLKHLSAFVRPVLLPSFVTWLALGVALAAFSATVVCWRKMGKSWRMGIDPNEKTRLILNGPYAYVRHPIYALSSVLMFMTLLIVPSPLMLIVAVIHIGLIQWEASREETYLVGLHGEAYAQYRRAVGRMVPRSFSPYHVP